MNSPGIHRLYPHVPAAFVPIGLAVLAIIATLFGWLVFAPSHVGTDVEFHGADVSNIHSIAYTIPGEQFDDVVVQPADGSTSPRVLATFPSGGPTGVHMRGAASPLGETIAVLWVAPFATRANLSLVDTSTGEVRAIDGLFDSLSSIAWSSDGTRVALTSTTELDGTKRTNVHEVERISGVSRTVASFEGAIDVAPVGYSFDSARLYVVVVDVSGSNLYAEEAGKSSRVAGLSPGRTRDWALSPDGTRLAFVDVLSGGARTYIGRSLVIATGTVTTLPAEKNQFGASWVPGSPLPSFGGPGGAWQLTNPAPDAAYLVPEDWSPDGAYLVATVYGADDQSGRPTSALEVITRESANQQSTRHRFSEARGAAFLGWVRDLN